MQEFELFVTSLECEIALHCNDDSGAHMHYAV
jgi:hypothetical protein